MSRARFGQCFLVLCEKREIERDAQMLMCQLFLCYRNHSICNQNLGRNLHLMYALKIEKINSILVNST